MTKGRKTTPAMLRDTRELVETARMLLVLMRRWHPGNVPLLIAEEQLAKVKASLGTALPPAEDDSRD
jgi:hypothetical protein